MNIIQCVKHYKDSTHAPQNRGTYIPLVYMYRDAFKRFLGDFEDAHVAEGIYLSIFKNRFYRYDLYYTSIYRTTYQLDVGDIEANDWRVILLEDLPDAPMVSGVIPRNKPDVAP